MIRILQHNADLGDGVALTGLQGGHEGREAGEVKARELVQAEC
jgi:hypothetical protein